MAARFNSSALGIIHRLYCLAYNAYGKTPAATFFSQLIGLVCFPGSYRRRGYVIGLLEIMDIQYLSGIFAVAVEH